MAERRVELAAPVLAVLNIQHPRTYPLSSLPPIILRVLMLVPFKLAYMKKKVIKTIAYISNFAVNEVCEAVGNYDTNLWQLVQMVKSKSLSSGRIPGECYFELIN